MYTNVCIYIYIYTQICTFVNVNGSTWIMPCWQETTWTVRKPSGKTFATNRVRHADLIRRMLTELGEEERNEKTKHGWNGDIWWYIQYIYIYTYIYICECLEYDIHVYMTWAWKCLELVSFEFLCLFVSCEEFLQLVKATIPEGSQVVKGEEIVLAHGISAHRKIAWLALGIYLRLIIM